DVAGWTKPGAITGPGRRGRPAGRRIAEGGLRATCGPAPASPVASHGPMSPPGPMSPSWKPSGSGQRP
ncbi:MAG: hypothetical protein M3Y33_18925, partial [Actinomycetota bacterium]|nr:hypothetical protein [Actinomycetota bacterium]